MRAGARGVQRRRGSGWLDVDVDVDDGRPAFDLHVLDYSRHRAGGRYVLGHPCHNDALEALPEVVAPAGVEGRVYFLVDSNDTDVQPLIAGSYVGVEPVSPGAPSPEQRFGEAVAQQAPGVIRSRGERGALDAGNEACSDGRNGDTTWGSAYGPVDHNPAVALAHKWGVVGEQSDYSRLARLAVEILCPDVQPVIDALDRGEVPADPSGQWPG